MNDRETFVTDNAIAMVDELEALAKRHRQAIKKLEQSRVDMRREIARLQEERNKFRDDASNAIRESEQLRARLLTAAGDDLCRLTQEEIKAMSLGAVKIPPKEEFLASCERFHAQVAGESGVNENCFTLAQLVAENERLRANNAKVACSFCGDIFDKGPDESATCDAMAAHIAECEDHPMRKAVMENMGLRASIRHIAERATQDINTDLGGQILRQIEVYARNILETSSD